MAFGEALAGGAVFSGGGGDGNRSVLQQLNRLIGEPLFGFVWNQLAAHFEGQELEDFRQEIKDIEEAQREDLFGAMAEQLAATENVVRQGLAATNRFFGGAAGRFADIADPLTGDVRQRTQLGIAGAEDIVRRQAARERRVLAEQEGLGDEERAALNRRFGALSRTQQGRLAGLGLGGSLMASGIASGVERARGNELALVNERLQRERVDLLERQSGETLSARAGALEFATGLRGEQISALGDLGFAGLEHTEQAELARIAEEERLGLVVPSLVREQAEARTEFEFGIVREPPIPDPNRNLLDFEIGAGVGAG